MQTEVMSVFDASLVPDTQREDEFSGILSSILDPVMRACTLSATALVDPVDMAVYMLNCLEMFRVGSSPVVYSRHPSCWSSCRACISLAARVTVVRVKAKERAGRTKRFLVHEKAASRHHCTDRCALRHDCRGRGKCAVDDRQWGTE